MVLFSIMMQLCLEIDVYTEIDDPKIRITGLCIGF